MERKCHCSFWRKCLLCLCCCKQVKHAAKSSASMAKPCSCSIWRRWFCLCKCEQVAEESDDKSDLVIKFKSKILSQDVTELYSTSYLKYGDKVYSGKYYSPAVFDINGKLVKVNSNMLIGKKCEREVSMLTGGLKEHNILAFIGIYLRPNSSQPILVTEKIAFSLLYHIEVSPNQSLKVRENFKLIADIYGGLKYLHDAKVVHLNFSTKSVLLTDNLTPKISNFEYAMYSYPRKDYSSLSEDDLQFIRLRDDSFMFQFLPSDYLELLQNQNQNCVEFIDVYSFGCVILNMFTKWPSAPCSSNGGTCNSEQLQNYWLSVITETEISNIVKTCLNRNAKQDTLVKMIDRVKKMCKDNCNKSTRVQTATSRPHPANDKTRIELKVTTQTQCRNASSQTQKVKCKDAYSQTITSKFKDTTSQTDKVNLKYMNSKMSSQTDVTKSCRCSVMQGQLKLSLEKNKNLSKEKIQLERDLVSSRRMLQQKKEELEKYYEKFIKAEEESFAFTNAFSSACEGSIFDLQNVYRHMQHNVRSAAVRAHKKMYPNIPLELSYHGMVAYDKGKSIAFRAFSDTLNEGVFRMQPPQSEAMQIQQDDTLRQCMKLLASFHKSVKHAEEEIKQSLLQEYEKLTKDTPGAIPDDVKTYYSMLAKFTWDCVARTIPMVMSTDEIKFDKEIHELKDDDDDNYNGEKHISYVYPILFTSNRWPREVAIKGKVKH